LAFEIFSGFLLAFGIFSGFQLAFGIFSGFPVGFSDFPGFQLAFAVMACHVRGPVKQLLHLPRLTPTLHASTTTHSEFAPQV
jgi:hypothetical protein